MGSAPEGKLDMTNVTHARTAPGLALVGDAAMAIDPLWGVGCGWALQSAEWLADGVSAALGEPRASADARALARGLKRYERTHRRANGGIVDGVIDPVLQTGEPSRGSQGQRDRQPLRFGAFALGHADAHAQHEAGDMDLVRRHPTRKRTSRTTLAPKRSLSFAVIGPRMRSIS